MREILGEWMIVAYDSAFELPSSCQDVLLSFSQVRITDQLCSPGMRTSSSNQYSGDQPKSRSCTHFFFCSSLKLASFSALVDAAALIFLVNVNSLPTLLTSLGRAVTVYFVISPPIFSHRL